MGSAIHLWEAAVISSKLLQSGQFSDSGGTWHCKLGIVGNHPDGGWIHNQGIVSLARGKVGWFASGSPGCAISHVQ